MVEVTSISGINTSTAKVNEVVKTTPIPASTDVRTLYAEFEKTASVTRNRGQKAGEIKELIILTAKDIGKNKLSLAALYRVIKAKYPDKKLDRSYFYNTALKQFENEKDDKEVVWIFTDKETQKVIPSI